MPSSRYTLACFPWQELVGTKSWASVISGFFYVLLHIELLVWKKLRVLNEFHGLRWITARGTIKHLMKTNKKMIVTHFAH